METAKNKNLSILLIDEEEKSCENINEFLAEGPYDVKMAKGTDDAIKHFKTPSFDIIIAEIELLNSINTKISEMANLGWGNPVILGICGNMSVEGAISAIRLGVCEFIPRPIEPAYFRSALKRASDKAMIRNENRKLFNELEKLNNLKDELISIVSHDLRSPLMTISGYVNFLIKQDRLNETQSKYLSVIREIADNTCCLVNELLDVSKIERGLIDISREEFDLKQLIRSCVRPYMLPAANKNNRIDIIDRMQEHFVYLDRIKISQVMNNLINNAIKFTENGAISILLTEKDSKTIEISVHDTGIGMNKHEIKKIFNRHGCFFKNGTRGEKGNGFGMVICKSFIELHGGSISVNSNPGLGTCFTIRLPRA